MSSAASTFCTSIFSRGIDRQFYGWRKVSESIFGYDFAVRPVKLEFFDHRFSCPICKEHIVYTSMQTVIVSSRRKCPSCEGELLIHEGTVTAISKRKPPKHATAASTNRRTK